MEKNTRKCILEREKLAQKNESRNSTDSSDSQEMLCGVELAFNFDDENDSINNSMDYL